MNTKYHIDKRDIVCPYCDKILDDWFELVPSAFETPEIIECNHCEKKFKVESVHCFTTHGDCKANGLKCDFREAHSVPGFFMCENCEENEFRKGDGKS